jgi:hypothetical protein
MGGGLEADDTYFDGALRLIDASWQYRDVEMRALVCAAKKRGRLPELDAVMERCFESEPVGQLRLEAIA